MEGFLYYVGQGLGVVAVILGFINYQVKTREQVLYVHIATTLCFGFHYMLIGAYAGMAMNFVAATLKIFFRANSEILIHSSIICWERASTI